MGDSDGVSISIEVSVGVKSVGLSKAVSELVRSSMVSLDIEDGLKLGLWLELELELGVYVLVSVEEEDRRSVVDTEEKRGDLKVTFGSAGFISDLSFLLLTNESNKVSNCCLDLTCK